MGGGENPLGVDQRAPTNVGVGILQTDLPRPLALWGQRPSHDPPDQGPQSTVWGEVEEISWYELSFSQSSNHAPRPRESQAAAS